MDNRQESLLLDPQEAQVLLDAILEYGETLIVNMDAVLARLDDIAVGREPEEEEQDEPEAKPERRRGVKPGSPSIGTGPLHIRGSGRALGPSALRRA